jgi:hypothetical protein
MQSAGPLRSLYVLRYHGHMQAPSGLVLPKFHHKMHEHKRTLMVLVLIHNLKMRNLLMN